MPHSLALVLTELSGSLIPTYKSSEQRPKTHRAIDSLLCFRGADSALASAASSVTSPWRKRQRM